MNRFQWLLLASAALLLAAMPASAQLVTVTASNINDGGQPMPAGTICFAAVGAPATGYQIGSTGQAGGAICRDVATGVIMTTLNGVVIGPMMVADTSLSAPQNLCYNVTVRDTSGAFIIGTGGAQRSGYSCVQTAANNSWCISGTCDFDNYVPNIPGLALGQSVADLTVGNLIVTLCTGCSSTGLPSGPANEVVATPNGSSGASGLRALVPADVPSLPESQITNLTSDLAAKLATALSSANIFVGNGSNVATGVAMSGDCGLSNAGAITCTKTGGTAFGALATLPPGAFPSGYTIPWSQVTGAPTILSIHGTITPGDCTYWYSSTALGDAGAACGSGGGGMVYPGAGVANSTGSGWGTSYAVGTGANDLVQLNSSAQLPALSGINLTGLNPANLGSGTIGTGVLIPWGQITGAPSTLSPALTSAYLFVGNASNVATGVAMSGDCGLSNAGAITCTETGGTAFGALATLVPGAFPSGYTIPWGQVTGAPSFLTTTLAQGHIFVGSPLNVAVGVAMSGDCGLNNGGAITCTETSGTAFGALATLVPGAFPSGYTIPWGQVTSQPTIPTSANWPNAGACPSGQYETTSTNGSAPTCVQVQYSQLGSPPTIPTSANWPNAGSCTSGQYETASTNGSAPTCAQVQYSQLGGSAPGGRAAYSTPFSFAMVNADNTSITGSSPIVLVANVGASAVTYEFSFAYTQTALGSGSGCSLSNVFVMLCYVDADSGVAIGGNCEDNSEYNAVTDGRLSGFTAPQSNTPENILTLVYSWNAGIPGLGSSARFSIPRQPIRVQAGSSIKLQIFQNNHNGCQTEPVFEAVPLLFGPF